MIKVVLDQLDHLEMQDQQGLLEFKVREVIQVTLDPLEIPDPQDPKANGEIQELKEPLVAQDLLGLKVSLEMLVQQGLQGPKDQVDQLDQQEIQEHLVALEIEVTQVREEPPELVDLLAMQDKLEILDPLDPKDSQDHQDPQDR